MEALNTELEPTFIQFIGEDVSKWHSANMDAKDHLIHEYLNVDLSLGVFTNIINENQIELHFDPQHTAVVDASASLEAINHTIESFINTLA